MMDGFIFIVAFVVYIFASCEFQYNRGRASNRSSWVFGMLGIKDDRRRPILKIVSRRSANHLMPLIKKHRRLGSLVISNGRRSYRRLFRMRVTIT